MTLAGTRVGVTAARQGWQLARAFTDAGAQVTWGPTVEVVAVPDERVRAETRGAVTTTPVAVIATTAEGLTLWTSAIDDDADLRGWLTSIPVIARGPKAAARANQLSLRRANTPALERASHLAAWTTGAFDAGTALVVQADGGGSRLLVDGLRAAGFDVAVVQPYRWSRVSDPVPAERLVRRTIAGELDVVTFTSAPAVDGMFEVAADLGAADDVRGALGDRVAVATVGPVTAEAVERHGVAVDVCPPRSRSAALVAAVATGLDRATRAAVALDHDGRTATVDGRTVSLADLEFTVLASLVRRFGLTCPREALTREAWGIAGARQLESLVSRLRRRVEPAGLAIVSVPKRGYRLERASEDIGVAVPNS